MNITKPLMMTKPCTFRELLNSLKEKVSNTNGDILELDKLNNLEVCFQVTFWSYPNVGILSYKEHNSRNYCIPYGAAKNSIEIG